MKLTDLLSKETVDLALEGTTKEDCIKKMADKLDQIGVLTNAESYLQSVLAREEQGSTGIGFGVAIPHGKSTGVAKPGLCFARLATPINWKSLDGNPVSIVFLIAVPEAQAGNEHLQILSSISRKLIHEEFRSKLHNATTVEDVLEALSL